ncbi:MAG: MoaD/ThiS family protein [Desulfobacula sp.]|jgi:molybdopterin converting factor small subunit
MRIHVTLYSEFKKFAPGGTGQADLTLPPGATLGLCLERLQFPETSEYTALINGRRAGRDSLLKEGDTLVIFPLISGG